MSSDDPVIPVHCVRVEQTNSVSGILDYGSCKQLSIRWSSIDRHKQPPILSLTPSRRLFNMIFDCLDVLTPDVLLIVIPIFKMLKCARTSTTVTYAVESQSQYPCYSKCFYPLHSSLLAPPCRIRVRMLYDWWQLAMTDTGNSYRIIHNL